MIGAGEITHTANPLIGAAVGLGLVFLFGIVPGLIVLFNDWRNP